MKYDMRNSLNPRRLTIAMWDFSWLNAHYPGGSFENFDKVTDELIERGFNTVRIEAFPWIIGQLKDIGETVTIPGAPLANWGVCDKDRQHDVAAELIEFMQLTQRKRINVILSTWGRATCCPEYPDQAKEQFYTVWERTLDLLALHDLLSHVLYVDLDQEFPYFSAFQHDINLLGVPQDTTSQNASEAMEAAGKRKPQRGLAWNEAQLDFVAKIINEACAHFQNRYPALRFTFSFTGFWNEHELLNLKCLDVLELHFWIHSPKFDNRSTFGSITKDRGERSYKDYQSRIDATLETVLPMLRHEMHQRLAQAQRWSENISAPLVNTESWGPWWHMDHPDLRWDWLKKWCAEWNAHAGQYGLWGSTPWNYCHPYWDNWSDIDWYRKVNSTFATS